MALMPFLTSATSLYLFRDSTAASYGHVAFLDVDASAPSSGDTLVLLNGVVFTVNQSMTTGATNNQSMILL